MTGGATGSGWKRGATCLGIVLAIALAARLTFAAMVVSQHDNASFTDLHGDTSSYLTLGKRMYVGETYTAGGGAHRLRGLIRPPGYPAFYSAVRGVYALFGVDLYSDLRPIVWPQAALSLLQVAATYLLALISLRSVLAATIAGLIAALSPTGIGTAAIAMPDCLFAACFAIAFVGFALAMQKRSCWEMTAVAGVSLAIAALMKPAAIYWPIVVVPALLLSRGFKRTAFAEMALLLAPLIFVVGAWTTRNYVSQGVPAYSIVSANNMRYEVASKVELAAKLGHLPNQAEFMNHAAVAMQRDYNYIREDNSSTALVYERITKETRDVICAHPIWAARVLLSNLKSEILWRYKLTKRQLPYGGNWLPRTTRTLFDSTDSTLALCLWYVPLLLGLPLCWRMRESRLPLALCWIGVLYIALPTASVANEGSRLLLASEPMAATLIAASEIAILRWAFSARSAIAQ